MQKISRPVLSIFADGLRHDSLSYMPFLSSLNSVQLETILGYSITCHPSMYSGVYPNKHKIAFHWIKATSHSPYRFFGCFPHIFPFSNPYFQALISHYYAKLFLKSSSFMGYTKILNLPMKYWKYLDINEHKYWDEDNYLGEDLKTIFELVRSNNIKHHISNLHKPNLGKINSIKIVNPSDYKWIFYFIGESDHISHEFIQHSEEGKAFLRKLDKFIKTRYEEFQSVYNDFTFIFWSDHGHIPIIKRYNLYNEFRKKTFNLNKIFHIIDSTTVRFWVKNLEQKKNIISVMNNIPEANLVTQSIFDELQLSNDNNLYGDLFYFLKGGFTFTHTIHGFGFKTNSMHGYHPKDQGNEGAFVSNKKINVTRAFLPDVFHTTIHALDIDYSPKILLDGRDILAS